MPKIQDILLKTAFYLYRTREDAEASRDIGGTGFIVGIHSNCGKYTHIYGVTNWHVAIRLGCSVIRVNTKDDKTDIFDLDPSQWTKHPDGYDIAVCSLDVDPDIQSIGAITNLAFATREVIEERGIGPGENVFMVGRFIDHEGGQTNTPAVRFGHISVMPSPIKQPTGKFGDSYVIDLHSRTGYSGSPVFVYRTPGSNFDTGDVLNVEDYFMLFLGIHWGQFPELWEIGTKKDKKEAADAGLITEGKYVKGVSGMSTVCPAWQILEILNLPQFKEERRMEEEEMERRGSDTSVPVPEVAGNISGDEILKTMLNMPPDPRTSKKDKPKNKGASKR